MITLVDANLTSLTFNILSPVNLTCSRVRYNLEASNCGRCPNDTDATTIICSNFTTSVEDTNMCNLTVGGVMCGNMTGDKAFVLINLRGWSIVLRNFGDVFIVYYSGTFKGEKLS